VSRTSYVSAIDKVLKPIGFVRAGREWIRQVGTVEEGVDLQTSQIAGATANFWSKDLATEALLPDAVPWLQPAIMVVFSTRIGQLMCGQDRWWKNDPNGPAELSAALQEHVDSFFEARRSLEAQAINYGRLSTKWGPSQINLALTLYRMGEVEEACRALEKPPRTIPEVWKRQAESVRNWILDMHSKNAK
jgi:hypothetical protein